MKVRFLIVDVFTDRAFGGNQLAVVPDAGELNSEQMQNITREFNFAESTFVLPPSDPANTRQVRIFTPGGEVPFAGHPNIGTAYALAMTGAVTLREPVTQVRFEELAGLVPVSIACRDGKPTVCELTAPEPLSTAETYEPDELAALLGLESGAVVTTTHAPIAASVGLPFVLAELDSRQALSRIELDVAGLARLLARGSTDALHVYTKDCAESEWDLQARMFAPGLGVVEDPATGSANCALAGLLASLDQNGHDSHHWRIAQGMEIGRPSFLEARVEKHGDEIVSIHIGGASVLVAEGHIDV